MVFVCKICLKAYLHLLICYIIMNTKTFLSLFSLPLIVSTSYALQATLLHIDCTKANIFIENETPQEFSISLKNIKTGVQSKIKSKKEVQQKLYFDNLAPDTEYEYQISDNEAKTLVTGKFKTAPDFKDRTPPPDFSFAVLGLNYINDQPFDIPFRTDGGEYEIFETVTKEKPNFVVWANGADTLRHADMGSLEAMSLRFSKSRKVKEAQNLLNNFANYGVMSNDSFGVDNADKFSSTADNAKKVFDNFWVVPQKNDDAKYYSFSYSDADFFVLDTCSQRQNLDYKEYMPQILGKQQLLWLMSNLSNSKAKFKIIILNSSLTNPVKSDKNLTFADKERKALLDFLLLKRIEGLVVISANKDYAEMTRFVRASAYPLHEATVGAFTGRPAKEVKEMNYFRLPNSAVTTRSFLLVKIDGNENDRRISLTTINSKGEKLFNLTLKEKELRGK